MVVDIKKLSEALRQTSPEEALRRDLQRVIRARRSEIEHALETTGTYVLRVPDGRRLRISRDRSVLPVPAAGAAS
jgi:hypothetical protein